MKCSNCLDSSIVSEGGLEICTGCGRLLARTLSTENVPYGYFPMRVRETYSREKRFLKILRNLQGHGNVGENLILGVDSFLRGKGLEITPKNIIFAVKRLPKELRNGSTYHRISSIFRALTGTAIQQLDFEEFRQLRILFREVESALSKKLNNTIKLSFSYLVPVLLHHKGIFRYDKFIKPIKSATVMARNESIFQELKTHLVKFQNAGIQS